MRACVQTDSCAQSPLFAHTNNSYTHRWVFMVDLGIALMYSVPILNYVLMKTSVVAPGDTTDTMAASALIMVCVGFVRGVV